VSWVPPAGRLREALTSCSRAPSASRGSGRRSRCGWEERQPFSLRSCCPTPPPTCAPAAPPMRLVPGCGNLQLAGLSAHQRPRPLPPRQPFLKARRRHRLGGLLLARRCPQPARLPLLLPGPLRRLPLPSPLGGDPPARKLPAGAQPASLPTGRRHSGEHRCDRRRWLHRPLAGDRLWQAAAAGGGAKGPLSSARRPAHRPLQPPRAAGLRAPGERSDRRGGDRSQQLQGRQHRHPPRRRRSPASRGGAGPAPRGRREAMRCKGRGR